MLIGDRLQHAACGGPAEPARGAVRVGCCPQPSPCVKVSAAVPGRLVDEWGEDSVAHPSGVRLRGREDGLELVRFGPLLPRLSSQLGCGALPPSGLPLGARDQLGDPGALGGDLECGSVRREPGDSSLCGRGCGGESPVRAIALESCDELLPSIVHVVATMWRRLASRPRVMPT